ncbi:FIG004556: membrane metalloprotease [hydrothermal vent metagenome]|uniref:FIG004556: membrane metalloprotease n=1 Tax=hydrothermal vent metagenome TaxID=652676 RepID=A0A3B1AJQ0_9ZZZZ
MARKPDIIPQMDELTTVQRVAVWALPVLFAITVHEVAHGWVAKKLGDPTAMMLGRLTLNPIKHIDPIGTVVVPIVLMLMGGFIFGWAKPVPVTWENLKNPRRDMALVAIAGPLSNLLMAILWALIMKLGFVIAASMPSLAWPLIYMGGAGIAINAILMLLNLLPIPPLDGGRVLAGLLPGPWAWQLGRIEPYGLFILVGLLATGMLGTILGPPMRLFEGLLFGLAGVG